MEETVETEETEEEEDIARKAPLAPTEPISGGPTERTLAEGEVFGPEVEVELEPEKIAPPDEQTIPASLRGWTAEIQPPGPSPVEEDVAEEEYWEEEEEVSEEILVRKASKKRGFFRRLRRRLRRNA